MGKKYSSQELQYIFEFSKKFIDPAIVEAIMTDIYPKENFKIMINKDMETAATRFDTGTGTHLVYIGTKFDDHEGLETDPSIRAFVQALFFHEIGHTLFTDKDIKMLFEECKKRSIPFKLLNLAEDARVEHLIKKSISEAIDTRYYFEWTNWLKTPEENGNMTPEEILYAIINTENRGGAIMAGKSELVYRFYDRFLKAKDTLEVLDILVDWIKIFHQNNPEACQKSIDSLDSGIENNFGQPGESGGSENKNKKGEGEGGQGSPGPLDGSDKKKGSGKGKNPSPGDAGCPAGSGSKSKNTTDMTDTLEMATNQAFRDEVDAGSVDYDEVRKMEEHSTPYRVNTSFGTVSVEECSNSGDIFNGSKNRAGGFYENDIIEVERLLKKLHKEKQMTQGTRKVSRRFNAKSMPFATTAFNTHKLYKEEVKSKKNNTKSITFILDLSGSMSGAPADSQRTILLAANHLAKMNRKTEIAIIGCKVKGRQSQYQTVLLPANEQDLLSCSADGSAEGIRYGMDRNKTLLSKSDVVVFITDGNIHDKEITYDHTADLIKKGGVSIGMYVGSNKIPNDTMSDWFDYTIINESLVESISEMVDFVDSNSLHRKKTRLSRSRDAGHQNEDSHSRAGSSPQSGL